VQFVVPAGAVPGSTVQLDVPDSAPTAPVPQQTMQEPPPRPVSQPEPAQTGTRGRVGSSASFLSNTGGTQIGFAEVKRFSSDANLDAPTASLPPGVQLSFNFGEDGTGRGATDPVRVKLTSGGDSFETEGTVSEQLAQRLFVVCPPSFDFSRAHFAMIVTQQREESECCGKRYVSEEKEFSGFTDLKSHAFAAVQGTGVTSFKVPLDPRGQLMVSMEIKEKDIGPMFSYLLSSGVVGGPEAMQQKLDNMGGPAIDVLLDHFVPPGDSDIFTHAFYRKTCTSKYHDLLQQVCNDIRNSDPHACQRAKEVGKAGSPGGCLSALRPGHPMGERMVETLVGLSEGFSKLSPPEWLLQQVGDSMLQQAQAIPNGLESIHSLSACILQRGLDPNPMQKLSDDASEVLVRMSFGDLDFEPERLSASLLKYATPDRSVPPPVRVWWTKEVFRLIQGGIDSGNLNMPVAVQAYRNVFWRTLANGLLHEGTGGTEDASTKAAFEDFHTVMTKFMVMAIEYHKQSVTGVAPIAVIASSKKSNADDIDQCQWYKEIDTLFLARKEITDRAEKDEAFAAFGNLICAWAVKRKTRKALKKAMVRVVDLCESADAASKLSSMQDVLQAYRELQNIPDDWDILGMVTNKKTYGKQTTLQCTLPPGAEPGMTIQVRNPNSGDMISVLVPDGARAGQTIRFPIEEQGVAKGLKMDDGDTDNLIHKKELDDPASLAFFQELLNRTFKRIYTRDRRGLPVPNSLKLVGVTYVANDQNWAEYNKRREEIKKERPNCKWLSMTHKPITTKAIEDLGDSFGWELPKLDSSLNEAWLWHGTSAAGAEGITSEDFCVDLAGSNAGTLYGRGVYLAEACSKSDEYATEDDNDIRHLLLVRSTLGNVRYVDDIQPDVDNLVQSCTMDGARYDSVLGDREKTRKTYREFIVYDDDQAYPSYILRYKRVNNS